MFPDAAVREGFDELTLGRCEEGMLRAFINNSQLGNSGWRLPFVDEDWHAVCHAICTGVEERDSQRSPLEWESQGHSSVESKNC